VRIEIIDWDDAAIAHIARHYVTPDEVEDVCFDNPLSVQRMRGNRWAVFGRTLAGRYLTVFIDRINSTSVFVVTARDATPSERRRLER
jgi:uncharacterized DUF497 family protein